MAETLPLLIEVHVDRLTRDFLLAKFGNPGKDFVLGCHPFLIHMFELATDQVVIRPNEKLPKPAKSKKILKVERPLDFRSTPILRSRLHHISRLLDDHADNMINQALEMMMISLKPGTAASCFVDYHELDAAHLGALKMRAYRQVEFRQGKETRNVKFYT